MHNILSCGCVTDLISNNAILQILYNHISDNKDYLICVIGIRFKQQLSNIYYIAVML